MNQHDLISKNFANFKCEVLNFIDENTPAICPTLKDIHAGKTIQIEIIKSDINDEKKDDEVAKSNNTDDKKDNEATKVLNKDARQR